jgi:hypothetical protein
MYEGGHTYEEVLQKLFGARSSGKVKNHKNCKDFNTKILEKNG